MWSIIIIIIVAMVIGSIGDAIAGGSMPGGFIGPVIAGFAIIPAIIGAALFINY